MITANSGKNKDQAIIQFCEEALRTENFLDMVEILRCLYDSLTEKYDMLADLLEGFFMNSRGQSIFYF